MRRNSHCIQLTLQRQSPRIFPWRVIDGRLLLLLLLLLLFPLLLLARCPMDSQDQDPQDATCRLRSSSSSLIILLLLLLLLLFPLLLPRLNRYALIHFLSCNLRTFDRMLFAIKVLLWLVNRSRRYWFHLPSSNGVIPVSMKT